MSAKPFSMTFNVWNTEKAERRSGGDAEGAGLKWNTDYWYGFANAPPRIARCARSRKSHGKRLEESLYSQASSLRVTFPKFPDPPNGGLPNPARRGKPRQGLGQGTVGGGELVHRAASGVAPQAVADGPSPSRFPKVARSALSASLRLCLSALKYRRVGAGLIFNAERSDRAVRGSIHVNKSVL